MDVSGSEGNGGDQSKRQGLIAVNDLTYVLEPDLSVAVNKTHKKHFFQSNEYTSTQRGICILNSGADYIDTRKSYLSFDIKVNASQEADRAKIGLFGAHGTACNLIDSILISTRSGDELCRISDYNLMQNMLLPLKKNRDWSFGQGGTMLYNGFVVSDGAYKEKIGEYVKCIIPMHMLTPLFAYGRLMPAMLMSGLRIEIEWASPNKAFQQLTFANLLPGGPGGTNNHNNPFLSYTIKDPNFTLCSVQLSDSIQRALNEQSAVNGLEIVYCDYERCEQRQPGSNSTFNVEVRKSCSRALKAYARVRCEVHVTATVDRCKDYQKDSFRGEHQFPWTEYQWQLGSLYFPQQPVKSQNGIPEQGVAKEAYNMLLETEDKFDSNQGHLIPFIRKFGFSHDDTQLCATTKNLEVLNSDCLGWQALNERTGIPQTIGNFGSYLADSHTLGVNLERSSMFNLAGVPVNNSRVLAFRGTCTSTTKEFRMGATQADYDNAAFTRILTIYLKYIKLARVFLNNVEVEQ